MKKNKHIAIFVPSFMGGGVERMMVYLANNFVSRGIKVDYIVIKNRGPYKKLLSENVTLVDLKKKRVLFAVFALAKYLRKNRPGVLLTAMNYVNILAFFSNLISFTKTRLVISERNILSNNISRSKFKKIFKRLVEIIYPKIHRITAISKDVKDDLCENFKINTDKVVVINNMVDLDVFNDEINNFKPKLFKELFNENYTFQKIIIGIGRLVELKNFKYLIESFSRVQKKNENVRLVILGEGPERKNLEKLIYDLNLENKVCLPGFLENSHQYLKIADVFVSTSLYEGFGNVIIEAMAAGLPVIVTNCKGGPKEIVDYGKYGDIVPLDNVKVLASKITERLNQSFDKTISINRAQDFSIEKISQEYLNVLFDE